MEVKIGVGLLVGVVVEVNLVRVGISEKIGVVV